jgi:hypothetical protein
MDILMRKKIEGILSVPEMQDVVHNTGTFQVFFDQGGMPFVIFGNDDLYFSFHLIMCVVMLF